MDRTIQAIEKKGNKKFYISILEYYNILILTKITYINKGIKILIIKILTGGKIRETISEN